MSPVLDISFIIPAFNEQKHLPLCLNSIHRLITKDSFEIILIDNGSTDSTVSVAQELGAKVFIEPVASIAKLRNIGASKAQGNLFIFLDADIELTEQWINAFKLIQTNVLNETLLTGSQASVPSPAKFIEKYWFEEFYKKQQVSHLGSAHLIISKNNFELIGGFNEKLETGEDYDFCQRAKDLDIKIINNLQLKVIHYGFPRKLTDFIKRESWHGKGDFINLKTFLSSKVAIASVFFLIAHFIIIFSLFTKNSTFLLFGLGCLFLILLLSTIKKYSHTTLKPFIVNYFIYYFYFVGRIWSSLKVLVDIFSSKKN